MFFKNQGHNEFG